MEHEERRWRALAAMASWGSGAAPRPELQERCVAALALSGTLAERLDPRRVPGEAVVGSRDWTDALAVLRCVPELAAADGERLSDIASWAAALYPAAPGATPRIQPDLIGQWFVVAQLTADPGRAASLREGMTETQSAHAIALLARAADHFDAAAGLFEKFVAGDLRRLTLAAVHAAMTGRRRGGCSTRGSPPRSVARSGPWTT